MSMLFLIRSADDVRSAAEAANELLAYRRRHFPEPREVDEVLGIWVRSELDADLPAWLWLGEGVPASSLAEAPVGIRESISLSGLWSLSWIDGAFLKDAKTARERRNRILDGLVKDSATQPRAFSPVFDATETSEGVEAMLQELRAKHPDLISTTWFIDEWEQGLMDPRDTR